MPPKAQAGPPSLTVRQYSDAVVEKYLRGGFAPSDPAANLGQAALALFELQGQLRAKVSNKDSEDAKAPLKAIRDAVDAHAFNSADGADSPQVDALFELYGRLEEICEDRIMAGGGDHGFAAEVQEALQYRFTRLVSGDQWEGAPKLKLRVLKLMHRFMVRENERILAAGSSPFAPAGGAGPAAGGSRGGRGGLGRQLSGKRAAVAGPLPYSRWGEAINELSKMQGARMLPLLKLCLLENLQLSTAAQEAAAEAAALAAAARSAPTPPAPATSAGSASRAEDSSARSPSAAPSHSMQSVGTSSQAGTGARAAAPTAPLTPARPGRLQDAPAALPRTASGHRRAPPPPPEVQPPPQQQQPAARPAQQAQHGRQDFGVDDLLGLRDEVPASPAQQAQTTGATAATAEELFAAFDNIAPPLPSTVATPTSPSGSSSGNPFADPLVTPAVHAVPPVMSPSRPIRQHGSKHSGAPQPETATDPGPEANTELFGPSSVPAFASFLGGAGHPSRGDAQALPSSLPSRGSRGDLQAFHKAAEGADTEGQTPSPYLGVTNPFTNPLFAELAPPIQRKSSGQGAPTPAGPPMRSLTNDNK